MRREVEHFTVIAEIFVDRVLQADILQIESLRTNEAAERVNGRRGGFWEFQVDQTILSSECMVVIHCYRHARVVVAQCGNVAVCEAGLRAARSVENF